METVLYVLIAVCGVLAAVAVVFLAVRPLLDPHWKDYIDESGSGGKPGARGPAHEA